MFGNQGVNFLRYLAIVPAYNEGKNIYNVVRKIKSCNPGFDVIVINDGSEDNTPSEAVRAGVKVLNLSNNLGIGGAVQTGYLYALENDYDAAVQIDGDGQHNSEDLCRLIKEIENNTADMVIGSRFVEKSNYKPGIFRNMGIHYFSKLVSLICNRNYYDTTSGYRIVNRKGIELFAKYYPEDYPEVETIVYAVKHNLRVKEIKVEMRKRQGGKSSITPLKSVYYMVKVTSALLIQPERKEVLW